MNSILQNQVEFLETVYNVNAAIELYEKHVSIATAKYSKQSIKMFLHYRELRDSGGSLEERIDYLELIFDVKSGIKLYNAHNKLALSVLGDAQFYIIDKYVEIKDGGER